MQRHRSRSMTQQLFLNYRRADGAWAGRIADRLKDAFGKKSVFMDVDSIPLGANFVKLLIEEVARYDVLLAVIGRQWLSREKLDWIAAIPRNIGFPRFRSNSHPDAIGVNLGS
jgi:hypothetical protein